MIRVYRLRTPDNWDAWIPFTAQSDGETLLLAKIRHMAGLLGWDHTVAAGPYAATFTDGTNAIGWEQHNGITFIATSAESDWLQDEFIGQSYVAWEPPAGAQWPVIK
jgi:hypothetical protein